jgi:hypothetical protein
MSDFIEDIIPELSAFDWGVPHDDDGDYAPGCLGRVLHLRAVFKSIRQELEAYKVSSDFNEVVRRLRFDKWELEHRIEELLRVMEAKDGYTGKAWSDIERLERLVEGVTAERDALLAQVEAIAGERDRFKAKLIKIQEETK